MRILKRSVIMIGVLLLLTACGQKQETVATKEKTVEDYLAQAKEVIQKGETEETLSEARENYEKALEMENDNPEAYLGIADVYIRENDYDNAKDILEEGMDTTGDKSIEQKIREMESGSIYDSDGKIRIRRGYDEAGNLKWYHKIFYKEDGKEKGTGLYNPEGEEIAYVEAVYDDQGRYIEGAGYRSADGMLTIGKITYDENGRRASDSSYTIDGEWERTCTYVYDDQGRVIEEIYDEPSGPDGSAKFDLDEKGNQIKISFYDANGKLTNYNTMEYDEWGNRIREDCHDLDGSIFEYYILEYNDDNVMIGEKKYDADGNLVYSNEG